jgi:hypothetical protein
MYIQFVSVIVVATDYISICLKVEVAWVLYLLIVMELIFVSCVYVLFTKATNK